MLRTVCVGPRWDLKRIHTRTVGSSNTVDSVGFRRIDWRYSTIVINPLEVNLRSIWSIDVPIILGRQGSRVLRRHRHQTTGDNVLRLSLNSRKLRARVDSTVSDSVDVDCTIFPSLGGAYVLCVGNSSGLWGSNRVNEWSYESHRERSGSDSDAATASYAGKTLHFHEKPFP